MKSPSFNSKHDKDGREKDGEAIPLQCEQIDIADLQLTAESVDTIELGSTGAFSSRQITANSI